jgi:hypothetical protein
MRDRYDDEALLADLAEALRETRPFADGVAARGKGAFTWRTIDEELLTAQLSFDSDHAPASTSRRSQPAAGDSRVLVFTTELRSVEVEVLPDRVLGQFIPPASGEVEVEDERGTVVTVEVDELGFFVIEPVPAGLVRLRCTTPTTRMVTAWIRL